VIREWIRAECKTVVVCFGVVLQLFCARSLVDVYFVYRELPTEEKLEDCPCVCCEVKISWRDFSDTHSSE